MDAKKIKKPTKVAKPKITKTKVFEVIFVLAWAGLSLIASQLVIGLPMMWILGERFSQPLWTCIYYGLNYSLALALVMLFPPKLAKMWRKKHETSGEGTAQKWLELSPVSLGVDKWPTFVDIGLAPIGYIVYSVLANLAMNLMQIFPWFQSDQLQDVGFGYFITTGDRVLAMLAIVFIAPIAEELIMRGWVYGKLRAKVKIGTAIVLTSLLFAVLHGQWNVGVGVFMLSVVLCSLREITGSIWSGMLLHILSNGIAFYILYIAGF